MLGFPQSRKCNVRKLSRQFSQFVLHRSQKCKICSNLLSSVQTTVYSAGGKHCAIRWHCACNQVKYLSCIRQRKMPKLENYLILWKTAAQYLVWLARRNTLMNTPRNTPCLNTPLEISTGYQHISMKGRNLDSIHSKSLEIYYKFHFQQQSKF